MAKYLMKSAEVKPSVDGENVWEMQEIFHHPIFVNGSDAEKKEIMRRCSLAKYKDELTYSWDHYFGIDLKPLLQGKTVLDLGCLTGGRGIAWAELYQTKHLIGVDVDETYIAAARQFAEIKNLSAEYRTARGEAIPLEDNSVDAVLSFDVFEHVQNPESVLKECFRVLKPGGRAYLVFPSYYQPVEHHLALVTRFPGLQYFFSGKTLVQAYWEILDERGDEALWYKRRSPILETWERGNTINGLTLSAFRKLIKRGGWNVVLHSRLPIAAIGRKSSRSRLRRAIAQVFVPMVFIPGLEEVFLHRVSYILEKT
jgi:SAM-dependent methyltransferase